MKLVVGILLQLEGDIAEVIWVVLSSVGMADCLVLCCVLGIVVDDLEAYDDDCCEDAALLTATGGLG